MPEPSAPPAKGQLHTGIHDDVVGHARPGTEAATLALKPVLLTGLFIVVFVGVSLAALRLYYTLTVSLPLMRPPRDFPQPQLQRAPAADLDALLADQKARLTGYGWVDRDNGVARMPIEEAMRRLAARGDAGFAAPKQPEAVPPLGSRGGASGALPSPDGQPGTGQGAASQGDR
ncbi:MAG: hypothetical protein INR63_07605 [Actinomycetospora chiangmaiensis]|jgi:hypothetical protein|nr:hypothetical protein [Actinomycetospora chiangmaiensis]